jgi:crotonobetainyl-CoA:carnitine CoA-transferase CaiB-like acyl-CoA transferase
MTGCLTNGMLSSYRVLDLTDEKGLLCGKLLADLGADVIKIEKPGGDSTRHIGPFYCDNPDPEGSLFWLAYNTNKRGITLNIETVQGQQIFRRLVAGADLVIESFPPDHMNRLGLGYGILEKINSRIIVVSITPFGQTGPYKHFKAPDIIAWAMGGQMYPCGDVDRCPVRVSHHSQAYLHAGAGATAAALIALYHREVTGEGQHIDLSTQDLLVQVGDWFLAMWDMMGVNFNREYNIRSNIRSKRIWPCKDGYVLWFYWGGVRENHLNIPLVKWMDSEGMADDFLRNFNWETFDWNTTTQDIVDNLERSTAKFFLSHTKSELLKGALEYGVVLAPVFNAKDTYEHMQDSKRGFWTELEHPELGTKVTYPGAFTTSSAASPRVLRRAPLVGEHNEEIYKEELGMSREQLIMLKQTGVI